MVLAMDKGGVPASTILDGLVIDPTKLADGAVFARDFRVLKLLKEGGMGAVYIAEQMSTGKQRALKLLSPELVHNPEIRDRFVREARAAANIESDHVVETVTAGVDEATGSPYIVMELLRGEELGDAAMRAGPLMIADVREVYLQIGHALEQAHAQGLVHRDLKPENIFLAASKRRDVPFTAKILDFGIAKLVADGMQKTGTQPLGSPLYMSPEQTDRKGRICPATDCWALGLIAFYLLTGKSFWLAASDDSLPALLREVCIDPIPRATERAQELGVQGMLPVGFDAWFAHCVDRDIDRRYPEAGSCLRAFNEVVADAPAQRKLSLIETGALATGPLSQLGRSADARPPTIAQVRTALGPGTTGASVATVQSAPAQKSRVGVYLIAALAVGALAGGVFFLVTAMRDKGAGASAAPAASSVQVTITPSTSVATGGTATAAAPAEDKRCPVGMIYHPSGKTFMGSQSLPDAAGAKVSGRKVQLSSFCLDKTEVTVRAYETCVADATCERTPDSVDYAGLKEETKPLVIPFCNARKPDRVDHPINCISYTMAAAYCKSRKARLPTEAEWEYAARGQAQMNFPWGNEAPDQTRLNAAGAEYRKWAVDNGRDDPTMFEGDDKYVGTAPVGSFPAGKSSYGVLDLAGNVWEWTQDWYAPYDSGDFVDPIGPATGTERAIRGGSFSGATPEWADPAWRYRSLPESHSHAIGFRCAADAVGEPRLPQK